MAGEQASAAYIVRRILAAVMDYGILIAMMAAYTRVFGELNEQGSYQVDGCHHFLVLFGLWVVTLPLPEAMWGQGIGKSLLGLKVTMRGNLFAPPNLQAVAKRHVTAFLEIGMCLGILPIIVILSTPARQRLGDLWAGTVVVSEDMESPNTGYSAR